jgi:hypothetical protein
MKGWRLVSALAVVFANAGCATEAPGQAVSPPTQSRSGEAPAINSPELDLASYENRVCELLTPDQIASFGIHDSGAPSDFTTGPLCIWKSPDTVGDLRISLAILNKVGYGWEGLYQRKARWEFFEAAGEINGYPAVHLGTSDTTNGRCTTTVGARMDLVFDALVQIERETSPDHSTPCNVSDRVASSVIDTLKKGSR